MVVAFFQVFVCLVLFSACTFSLFSVQATFDPFGGSSSGIDGASRKGAFAHNDSFSKFDPFAAFGSTTQNSVSYFVQFFNISFISFSSFARRSFFSFISAPLK